MTTIATDSSFISTGDGRLFLKDAQGQWHEWVGGQMVAVDDPTTGLSTDNMRVYGSSSEDHKAGGELVTLDGAFSFDPAGDDNGNYQVLLNGQPTGGRAAELAIFGGNLYARPLDPRVPDGSAGWHLWAGGRWVGMS